MLLGGRGSLDDVATFLSKSGMMRAMLGDVTPEQRERALTAITEALAPRVTDDGVPMGAATWIVTARKP